MCALLILTVFDGLIAQFRHPVDVLDLLPGQSDQISGPLRDKEKGIQDLTYSSGSDLITLSFGPLQSGFWFGQKMWTGAINVDSRIEPGEYKLSVRLQGDPSPKPLSAYRLKVYKDSQDYRANSLSFIRRSMDISPWILFAVILPFTAAMFGAVFHFSQKEDDLLAAEGRAEIYRIAKGEWGVEIAFGMGARHGVATGDSFALLDEEGRDIGVVVASKVSEKDAVAQVGVGCNVKPGYMVRRI